MPLYSSSSETKLQQAHPDLQVIFRKVLSLGYDHTIAISYETKVATEDYFNRGLSKIHYPTKHNSKPSAAIDVYPYIKGKAIFGVNETELKQVLSFASLVMGVSIMLLEEGKITHKIRNGGDWNEDFDINDNPFEDAGHFEIIPLPGETFQYFET